MIQYFFLWCTAMVQNPQSEKPLSQDIISYEKFQHNLVLLQWIKQQEAVRHGLSSHVSPRTVPYQLLSFIYYCRSISGHTNFLSNPNFLSSSTVKMKNFNFYTFQVSEKPHFGPSVVQNLKHSKGLTSQIDTTSPKELNQESINVLI